MSVLRLALRWARRCATTRTGDFYRRAHPRMNAALKAAGADWKIGTSRRWSFFCCARRNENDRSKVEALRRRYRVAGKTVEIGNESAPKRSDLSERVNFAASVFNLRRTANVHLRLGGLVSPGSDVLCFFKFLDELSKSRFTVTDARALAQHCIEAGGFTIVVYAELFVALNSAGTDSETQ